MRTVTTWTDNWLFAKTDCGPQDAAQQGSAVALPHTWNAKDGTDGGNDYYRGRCWYARKFDRPALQPGEECWLEFEGVAMSAEVYCNGVKLATHEGGYSTFRVNLTPALQDGDNLLAVSADNSANDRVYPQKADFTFYGGIYRPVKLLVVPAVHFALGYHGGPGIKVTPQVDLAARSATVTVETWVEGDGAGHSVCFTLAGQTQNIPVQDGCAKAVFTLENVHLWDGVHDPFLYTVIAALDSGDSVQAQFGCRAIGFDANKGFILNGRPYRLCGAARHQDRAGMGYAITNAEHDEDMALLREMGANTVRLAHYQHAQHFYDLCDRYGMIVWAEIPYITQHLPTARENTISQMTELIVQNYNHPSIICWGLSNEITASGGVSDDLVDNHKVLNNLCHELDATRPTTMAHAFMLDANDPFVCLSDIRSYNLYYGWYLGELQQNDEFFDKFHTDHPDAVIGLSEYGADANPAYQSEHPEKGDWTEGYQALYHEHLLKMWSERPYIWAMHCWNMFDFGADGRDEGGKPGQNQKGLVTFDRKTKKDAFYVYKAYLSDEPFVHLCGRRYADRADETTQIRVYSNQPMVTLTVDELPVATKTGDKVFVFDGIKLTGIHTIRAVAGTCTDEMTLRKVDKPNPDYVKEGGAIVNWFDKPEEIAREGYYSILDSMETLKKNPATAAMLARIMAKATESYGDVAKNVQMPEAIQRQMDKMPLQSLLKQAGKAVGPEMVRSLNDALNKIPRTE